MRFLIAVGAGVAAGGFLGILDVLLSGPSLNSLRIAIFNIGLVFPFALGIALITALGVVFIVGKDPTSLLGKLHWKYENQTEHFSALSLVIGLNCIVFSVISYHVAFGIIEHFHHPGLMSLLISVFFVGLILFQLSVGARAVKPTTFVLKNYLSKEAVRRLAILSLLMVPSFIAAGIVFSPVEGSGLFGFWGLLKREEIQYAPLIAAFFCGSAVLGTFLVWKHHYFRVVVALLSCTIGIGSVSFFFAMTKMSHFKEESEYIQNRTALGGVLLQYARKASDFDQDGVSGLFGGGDCDDRDKNRRPGAIDIPENGVDEDCTGTDYVRSGNSPNLQKRKSARPAEIELPEEMSLVILTVDALRWDTGYMGYSRPITKNIDRMAERSIVFENAYALSSFTGRSLAPMFIGRYPSEAFCDYSHFTKYLSKNEMLAEVLRDRGFRTAGIGSHFYFQKQSGLNDGFEQFHVEIPPGRKHIDQKVTSDLVADRALKILRDEEFTRGRFFLWAHFMDPHRDYLSHPEFSDFGKSPRDRYDGEVAFTDHHVGRVLDALDQMGLLERTVVMVTSDHGEAFREHDVNYHGRRLWEEIIRVPWVIYIPKVEPQRIRYRVSQLDLVATVFDILRVEGSAQNRGRSLIPFISGSENRDRLIFVEQPPGEFVEEVYALIYEGYKLIHSIQGDSYQLFNLNKDPGEFLDLKQQESDLLTELKAVYRQTKSGLERNAPRR